VNAFARSADELRRPAIIVNRLGIKAAMRSQFTDDGDALTARGKSRFAVQENTDHGKNHGTRD
jgi:hypothetical protein